MRLRYINSLPGAGAFAAALLLFSQTSSFTQPVASLPPEESEPILHLSTGSVKTEITAVIEAQLAAFRAGDYRKAHTFAAAEIQEMFGVHEFEAMVRTGYPMIAQSKSAAFGLALDTGDEAVVTVRVITAAGDSAAYQYHMVKQDGTWRIAGVTEVKGKGMVV